MKNLILYFIKRPLFANLIFVSVFIFSIFSWIHIGKEEMPNFVFDWIRISVSYPSASSEDIESMVTIPIEKELRGINGIDAIESNSSSGSCSVLVKIHPSYTEDPEVLQNIKDAVLRVKLPSEIRNLPSFRQFKSSEKAIMDIGIIYKNNILLDTQKRNELQQQAIFLENQLLSLDEVSSIDMDNYLSPELKISLDNRKMYEEKLGVTEISNQIQNNNIRTPLGSLEDSSESKLTLVNTIESKENLEKVFIRGNYQENGVSLDKISSITNDFEKSTSILKINGHEGLFLNIKKSISVDILTAKDKIFHFLNRYKETIKNSPFDIFILDDESFDVRNRLNIILSNGLIGFVLLLIVLLLFLNFKIGFWVAMGIPFSISFTLIFSYLFGQTVNNMTLAAIIIVLGIVVDDAIIISENIMRKFSAGNSIKDSLVYGTTEMFVPILGSVSTTVVAFIPLLYFEGHFGKFVSYIPLIIFLMLLGSLLESLFILPIHLNPSKELVLNEYSEKKWFLKFENFYKASLHFFMKHHVISVLFSLVLLLIAGTLFVKKMKFVMFPREESREVLVKVKTPKGTSKQETAIIMSKLEKIFIDDKDNIVGIRAQIAKGRRGGEVYENEGVVMIELKPLSERKDSLNSLIKKWEKESSQMKDFSEVKFLRGRWGHDSGSPIELRIQENDDSKRDQIANDVKNYMENLDELSNVEFEDVPLKDEYLLVLDQKKLEKYNVSSKELELTLKSYVDGVILYSFVKNEEEINVRLVIQAESKVNTEFLQNTFVENKNGNLVSISKMVKINKIRRFSNIKRVDGKRTSFVYADFKEGKKVSPIEIAEKIEAILFPKIYEKYPSAILKFVGEVEDTRESQGDFKQSILFAIFLIYFILVLIFNSLSLPILILAIVPFGLAGVIFTFLLHGLSVYGFFAVIGAIGMIGVVVNDSIVMINQFQQNLRNKDSNPREEIVEVATSRLRPVILTTLTTVIGLLPTAYGWLGFDSMLAEMMLSMGWGLVLGTAITLILVPILYSYMLKLKLFLKILVN